MKGKTKFFFYLSMILVLVCVFIGLKLIDHALEGANGTYMGNARLTGAVRLSLVSKDNDVQGELSYGRGALMQGQGKVSDNGNLQMTFVTPDQWVAKGQAKRQVQLEGILTAMASKKAPDILTKGDRFEGYLRENGFTYQITLNRDESSSILKTFESQVGMGH